MKNLKTYEGHYDLIYSVGDIVVCSTKNDDNNNYAGYIDSNDGKFKHDEDEPIYGKKYKVLDAYWHGTRYTNITLLLYGNAIIDIEDIETGKKIKYLKSNLFSLASTWKKPDEPMIGDYVICDVDIYNTKDHKEYINFIKNNIGRFINAKFGKHQLYTIQYLNIPHDIEDYFWNTTNPHIKGVGAKNMVREEIIYYSPNKDDLKYYLDSIKYNL